MSIKVLTPGLLTTVQDNGRTGYRKFGFSQSGVMDSRSYRLANALAGNFYDEAVLEMTLAGGSFVFLQANHFAITGADMNAKLDGEPVSMYKTLFAREGSTLSFSVATSGVRTYVAFSGGIDVPMVMGSRSTNLKCSIGGFDGRKLKSGDVILFSKPACEPDCIPVHKVIADNFSSSHVELRVVMGPQDDLFTEDGKRTFLSSGYCVTQDADRMGYKLEGKKIEHKDKADIISDAIAFGSVQVPSSGQPIIMLADRQTTGGYAKIATVISSDLPKLVQAKPGSVITFNEVSRHEAEKIYKRTQKEFDRLLLSF